MGSGFQAARMVIGIRIKFGLGGFATGRMDMFPFLWLSGEIIQNILLLQTTHMIGRDALNYTTLIVVVHHTAKQRIIIQLGGKRTGGKIKQSALPDM